MTSEQLATLKGMTKGEIARRYTPMLLRGEIDQKTYDYVCSLARYENPYFEDSPYGISPPRGHDGGGAVAEPLRPSSPPKPVSTMASQKGRLLNMLRDGLWHSTVDIMRDVYGFEEEKKGVCRIASRVGELRKEGFKIKGRRKSKGVWEYRLCPIESV